MNGLDYRLKWKAELPAVRNQKWVRCFFLCAGLAGLGAVSFLSLRSSSAISTVWWIPKFIANWADRHGRFDNFPAYGLMGVPFFLVASTFRRQIGSLILLCLFVVLLELAQLAIPTRHCDIGDMFWGSLGLLAAFFACEAFKRLRIEKICKLELAR
jgi:glycopeptide antibiotics resistance protein